MRKLLFIVLLILSINQASAQLDPQFSLYMFNKQITNPAYAGASGAAEITLGGRSQWVGIDGQPNTGTLTGSLPISVIRGAIGLNFMQDNIGPFSTTAAKFMYSFRLPLGQSGPALHIGVAPGFFYKAIDPSGFRTEMGQLNGDPYNLTADPVLVNLLNNQSGLGFDLGAGVYFTMPSKKNPDLGLEKVYAGFSVDHITQPRIMPNVANSTATLPLAMGVMAGYNIEFNSRKPISLFPSVNFKMAMAESIDFQLDASLNLHIYPIVFGVSYRGLKNVESIVGTAGFHASRNLFVAYSYDYSISGLSSATSGSHELVISYRFPRVVKYYPPDLDVKENQRIR